MKCAIVVFLIVFNQASYSAIKIDQLVKECDNEYKRIIYSGKHEFIDGYINEWANMREQCAAHGIYEKNLADIYIKDNKYKKAKTILNDAIERLRKGDDVRFLEEKIVGLEYYNANYGIVRDKANEFIRKYPGWYAGYFYNGLFSLTQDEYEQAEKYFLRSLQFENTYNAHAGLTVVYYSLNNYEKAADHYSRGFRIDGVAMMMSRGPSFSAIISNVIVGDLQSAKTILDFKIDHDKGIEKTPGYKAASIEYKMALKKPDKYDYKDADLYCEQGLAFYSLDDLPRAYNSFSKAIEINPEHFRGYKFRAAILDKEQKFTEAIADYNKAIEISPEPYLYNSKGASYFDALNHEEAINSFNQAIAIDPNYPDPYFNLGLTYSDLGDIDKTIESFKKASELNPQHIPALEKAIAIRNSSTGKK